MPPYVPKNVFFRPTFGRSYEKVDELLYEQVLHACREQEGAQAEAFPDARGWKLRRYIYGEAPYHRRDWCYTLVRKGPDGLKYSFHTQAEGLALLKELQPSTPSPDVTLKSP